MSDLQIEHNDQNGVTWLRLNRSQVHNAFDDNLIAELTAALTSLADAGDTRILVLASEGKHFSAGADLNWMKKTADYSLHDNQRDALKLARMLTLLNEYPAPTIARIQGAAFGGGVGLIACCDIAIATHNATFSFSEVKLGLIPATISPFVIEAIGSRQARKLFLTGEQFDASTAKRTGLIHDTVEQDELDASVEKIIDTLLQGGPTAQAKAKELIRDVQGMPRNLTLERETANRIAQIRATPEGQEGIAAFLQKRKANWLP